MGTNFHLFKKLLLQQVQRLLIFGMKTPLQNLLLKMKSSISCSLSFHTVCRNLTEELWFYVSRVIAKNALGFMAWWTTIFWEAGQNETKKIVIPNGLCQLFLLQCWNHAVLTSAIFGLRLWQKPPKTSPCFGPMASHLNWLLDLWIGLVWMLYSKQSQLHQ